LESLDDILKIKCKTKINLKKTEVMVCSKDFENINIKMDECALKQISNSKYFVVQLQKMGKIEKI
jgi:hypothetical protein